MHENGTWAGPPLRLALYSGLCIRHDAISNALRLKLDIVQRWRARGAAIDVTAFVHATDYDDPHIRTVRHISDLLCLPEFRAANVHVFEFGIYYPLFDAVFLLPNHLSSIAVYHNITPPELADDPSTRAILERSMVQRHNLSQVQHVVTDSDYSRRQLLNLGFSHDHLSVIPLPSATPTPTSRRPSLRPRHGRVELLYVGRLVRGKGVLDLLRAISMLAERGTRNFCLTLVGNPSLSSPDVVKEVREACADPQMSELLRFIPAPDTATLAELYTASDVFVMPSYHEGYCVPVIEALTAGCQVIAYDSTNLPFVLGGLGTLVPTGDVHALASALATSLRRFQAAAAERRPLIVWTERGDMEESLWRQAVLTHLEEHSETAFETKFATLLRNVVAARPALQALGASAEAPL